MSLEIIIPATIGLLIIALAQKRRMKKRRKEIRRLETILLEHGIHNGEQFKMLEDKKWYKRFIFSRKYN